MKHAKLLALALLASLAITGCGSGEEKTPAEPAKTASEAIEAAVDAAMEQSKEALNQDLGSNEGVDLAPYEENFTFILDGKEMHLDCAAKELFDDGWVFSNDAVTMDGPDVVTLNEAIEKGTMFDAVETPDHNLFKTKDGKTYQMMVGLYSTTVEKKTLPEYHLGFLFLDEEMGLQLEMKTGITFGSTVEEVKEVYGEPVTETDGVLFYQFTEGEVTFMPERPEFLNFYVRDGKVYRISLQFFPVLP